MRAVILAAPFGHGHHRAAEAAASALRDRGAAVSVVDVFSLVSPALAKLAADAWTSLLKLAPSAYAAVYKWTEGAATPSDHVAGKPWALRSFLGPSLIRLLDELRPDLVAATHPAPLALAASLRREGFRGRLLSINTDYTIHGFVPAPLAPGCGLCCAYPGRPGGLPCGSATAGTEGCFGRETGMSELMTWVLLTLFGYVGLPTLLMRLGFARTLKKENARRPLVALTFDDGPDPFWTPVILEILDRFNATACFFMLGAKAAAYPDLVRRVAEAGHEIGVHGFKHAVPAFLGFRQTMQDVSQTAEVLTAITGKRPRFMRPPWGVFNLWTALAARRNGLIPVVWSLHVYEWDRSTTPRSIFTTAMRRSHPGMVLLLHDSAGPGSREDAPEVVAGALPRLITGLREEGYHLVSLSQLLDSPQGETAPAAPDRTDAVDSGRT